MNKIDAFWLINKSEDICFGYIFADTGEIIGLFGDNPTLMKTRVSLKVNEARKIYKRLLSQGWRKTRPIWS